MIQIDGYRFLDGEILQTTETKSWRMIEQALTRNDVDWDKFWDRQHGIFLKELAQALAKYNLKRYPNPTRGDALEE